MFSATIEEALQLRYEHLKGLKGLRVRDMRFRHSDAPVDVGAHASGQGLIRYATEAASYEAFARGTGPGIPANAS